VEGFPVDVGRKYHRLDIFWPNPKIQPAVYFDLYSLSALRATGMNGDRQIFIP